MTSVNRTDIPEKYSRYLRLEQRQARRSEQILQLALGSNVHETNRQILGTGNSRQWCP
jgi:hypothetical protein